MNIVLPKSGSDKASRRSFSVRHGVVHCAHFSLCRRRTSHDRRRLHQEAALLGEVFIAAPSATPSRCPYVHQAGRLDRASLPPRRLLRPLQTIQEALKLSFLMSNSLFCYTEKFLDSKQPNYDISRSLLRSGPAASLRINIRAVAQYATEDGNGKAASDAVEQCLRALEDLDSLLLNAIRNDPRASTESMKGKLDIVLGSLDSLLQTVPSKVLDQGKAIADAYMDPSYQSDKPAVSDTEITKLEALF
ncbi:hypothetical protein ZIOFF_026954 [Zingiber officinale]|uniref:DUF7880 domain-containing protein n=1 Tax=Zingiber officinale TaxID=94328 RepID=A0A8J5HF75_ZINOF|nr:hypothetical protein ZIOFF_074757 [Zingiber officinale]KAG6516489.1 hypothetical protein ZIOFF_026954 [Zingiber officinale]